MFCFYVIYTYALSFCAFFGFDSYMSIYFSKCFLLFNNIQLFINFVTMVYYDTYTLYACQKQMKLGLVNISYLAGKQISMEENRKLP